MFIELINLGQVEGVFGTSLARSKTQKRLLGSPLGRFAATRLRRKAMRGNLINQGQERSVDTSYRALARGPHHTDCAMLVLRGFCDGPMARALQVAKRKRGFPGCVERAIGALWAVQS